MLWLFILIFSKRRDARTKAAFKQVHIKTKRQAAFGVKFSVGTLADRDTGKNLCAVYVHVVVTRQMPARESSAATNATSEDA